MQATKGNNAEDRPMWAEKGGLDFEGRAKWDAWTAVKGTPSHKAMLAFVKVIALSAALRILQVEKIEDLVAAVQCTAMSYQCGDNLLLACYWWFICHLHPCISGFNCPGMSGCLGM